MPTVSDLLVPPLLVPPQRDRARLAGDEIAALLEVLALDRLPPVLGHRPGRDDEVSHDAAIRRGRESLRSRGLLDATDAVDPEVRDWMWALVRPLWQMSVRVLAGGVIVDRFCLAAGGRGAGSWSAGGRGAVVLGRSVEPAASATRSGETAPPDLEVRRVSVAPADVVLDIIGRPGALAVGVAGQPADMVADLLTKRASPNRTAALLQRWGLDERRARLLAGALANEQRYVEIVVERRVHEVPVQVAEPIAVIDTAQGRLLVVTSTAADGNPWRSLVPGSVQRLAAEIGDAIGAALVSAPRPRRTSCGAGSDA